MRILKNLDKLKEISSKKIVSVGNFDGVHLGHQKILRILVSIAKSEGLKSAVITFDFHPKSFKKLTILDEKKELIGRFGVDFLFTVNFDDIKNLDAFNFLKILKENGVVGYVSGRDHRFGLNREGNIYFILKNSSFDVVIVSDVEVNGVVVKSSFIREYLQKGFIERVNLMLGRRYSVSGVVVKGSGVGRLWGVPTANILYSSDKLIPPPGVYAVYVYLGNEKQKFLGACNIDFENNLEVHIFNFSKDLYGESLKVEFIRKISEEKIIKDIEKLKAKIKWDLQKVKDFFKILER